MLTALPFAGIVAARLRAAIDGDERECGRMMELIVTIKFHWYSFASVAGASLSSLLSAVVVVIVTSPLGAAGPDVEPVAAPADVLVVPPAGARELTGTLFAILS